MEKVVNSAKQFAGFREKAEKTLFDQFPTHFDSGKVNGIHIGRNKDGGLGDKGGYRVRGNNAVLANALLLDVPSRTLDKDEIANDEAKRATTAVRCADEVRATAKRAIDSLMSKGLTEEDAINRVNDDIKSIGYIDQKTGKLVAERVADRVNDSVLAGLQTPYWDIARIKKIFRQPFLKGMAEGMVSKIGVPNVWADLVQIYTEKFEGYARVSNVGRTTGQMNTSIGVKNTTGTMLSEVVNLAIDYEAPQPNERMVGGMQGNWLTNSVIGDRDRYANLMLEQLMNQLYYFGNEESGFDGLEQIATRDGNVTAYTGQSASELWDLDGSSPVTPPAVVNETAGADLLLKIAHLIADAMEAMYFLPTKVVVRCSPIVYKVLKFSMVSKKFNQNSPLSIMGDVFEKGGKLVGTMASKSGEGLWQSFEIVPDAMLMPNTPFNPNSFDIMYLTFPALQSALDGGMKDLIIAPVPIDKLILPSAPAYRDGIVRTCIKRVGSLLAPVSGLVHKIEGIGYNEF